LLELGNMTQKGTTAPALLLVDNSTEHQKLLGSLAKQLGMSATAVKTCGEAMAALQANQFDLILMDWEMPDMDGPTCTALIREMQADTGLAVPIIGCTARTVKGARDRCLQAGMDDYIAKPFTLPQLKEVLDKWLAFS